MIPDHETAVDFLNHEAISKTVAGVLKENRSHPITIGIHGDWGAGKSSILKMIESEFRGAEGVLCVWFNSWTSQDFDDAKIALLTTTIDGIREHSANKESAVEIFKGLMKRVNFLKVAKRGAEFLPSLVGIEWLAKLINSVSDKADMSQREDIGGDVSGEIRQFRKEFDAFLDEAGITQLIVLIDDLDRCLPETTIAVLEAIRLFLFAPKTAFIIGADESMIEYAVRHHFPDLPVAFPYARNYLEKLIQIPFRIPALGVPETKAYTTLLLVENLLSEDRGRFIELRDKVREILNRPWSGKTIAWKDVVKVAPGQQDNLKTAYLLSQQIGPILAKGTKGNPRQVKRFLNALLVREQIARARGFDNLINRTILAKLMLAERFQPDFYEEIAKSVMASKKGFPSFLGEIESPESKKTKKDSSDKRKLSAESWDQEWVEIWGRMKPMLAEQDLRPYVFVARDKRGMAVKVATGDIEELIENLFGSPMKIRSLEPEIKKLSVEDAETAFNGVSERVLAQGDFNSEPNGFSGMSAIATHHPIYRERILHFLKHIPSNDLGPWVVKGWANVIPQDIPEYGKLVALIDGWAVQDQNNMLKTAAKMALPAMKKRI